MLYLKILQLDFPQAKPVSISFHTWDCRQSFLAILKYNDLEGLGEGNPFKPITGDSPEEFICDAGKVDRIPLNPEQDGLSTLHDYLGRISCNSLKSALDLAYHDLVGKIKGYPVYRMYADNLRPVENSVTVFLQDSIEKTVREAEEIYRLFPSLRILKIKLKGEQDVERTRAIKQVSPPGMKFVLDANQGFSDPKRAVDTLSEIGEILKQVILVEEPCPKEDLDKLKYVKENLSGMLVFADESATTLESVKKVADRQAAHGVNIKLQKAGGIWPSKQIADFCQQRGLKIMIGAMIEGPVAINAGVQFAVSTDDVVFSDLDTDLDLPCFTDGHSDFSGGMRLVTEKNGLGLSLNTKAMEKLQREDKLKVTKII